MLLSAWTSYAQDTAKTSSITKYNISQCTKEFRKAPPIWVTDTGFDDDKDDAKIGKENLNYAWGSKASGTMTKEEQLAHLNRVRSNSTLRSGDSLIQNPALNFKTVPKRSVVKLDEKFQKLVETQGDLEKNSNKWVPIKVISVPSENYTLRNSTSEKVASVAKSKIKDPIRVDDEGFIQLGNLEKVARQKDFVFIVKRDSPLFKALHDKSNPMASSSEVFALELHQVNGLYQVNRCCTEDKSVCEDLPIFKAVGVKNKNGEDVFVEHYSSCLPCVMKNLVPVEGKFADPLKSILSHPALGLEQPSALQNLMSIDKLKFVDTRGFVQIPVRDIKNDQGGRLGPYNSYNYDPGGFARPGSAEVYMRPESACGFMRVLERWDKEYCKGGDPTCRIEFGHASHAEYRSGSNWGHSDHDNGDCVDIRPFGGKDDGPRPRTFHERNSNDRGFGMLLKLFEQLGSTDCFLNDAELVRQNPWCKTLSGKQREAHSNHLHVCFPRQIKDSKGKVVPNLKLQRACQEGVK